MKGQIFRRARKSWDDSVWSQQNHFDAPGAAIVRKVDGFPYIGSPDKQFGLLEQLGREATPPITFLQAFAAGQPLVSGSWFEYVEDELDFNRHENELAWILPEIVPRVGSHVDIDAGEATKMAELLWDLPSNRQNDLLRSMKRFSLSQCRHNIVDQVVDLAIAFEIALHGDGEGPGPMTWKSGLRSAQLIGGQLSERMKTRAVIDDLYKLRNKGAHGSNLSPTEHAKHELTVKEARAIYRRTLASLLPIGALPDWKSIELEPPIRSEN